MWSRTRSLAERYIYQSCKAYNDPRTFDIEGEFVRMATATDMTKEYSIPQLLRITAPSMVMVLLASIYDIVDGLFISNCVGKTAFASINLVMPFIMILASIGFMMGTGGSEVVSKARGEGNDDIANKRFSLLVYFTFAIGVVCAVLGALFMEPVSIALGADDDMLGYCVYYGRMCMVSLPAFMLQFAFQAFFTAAGKPKLGLLFSTIAGVLHVVLDAVLIAGLSMGLEGAVISTIASEFLGGFLPLIYFAVPNSSYFRLGKTSIEPRIIGRTCVNGSSELVTIVSDSVVAMVYNFLLMDLYGENGVAAYGACMYLCFVFIAVFEGYNMGCAPLMSFAHGAENKTGMADLYRKSMKIVSVFGVLMFALAEALAGPFAFFYTGYDAELFELTEFAFRLFSVAYLICGFSMYGSSLFTSLGNGLVSGVIAFLRVFVFEMLAIILMPQFFGAAAIWLGWTIGEVLALGLTVFFMIYLGRGYGYLKKRDKENATAH